MFGALLRGRHGDAPCAKMANVPESGDRRPKEEGAAVTCLMAPVDVEVAGPALADAADRFAGLIASVTDSSTWATSPAAPSPARAPPVCGRSPSATWLR
ncbi:MAG TPA: hypothetical protein VFH70_12735 [Acidimicrobiales bacterium]|nr:hypothetical protein [Acidimicrobiales bacterium]